MPLVAKSLYSIRKQKHIFFQGVSKRVFVLLEEQQCTDPRCLAIISSLDKLEKEKYK